MRNDIHWACLSPPLNPSSHLAASNSLTHSSVSALTRLTSHSLRDLSDSLTHQHIQAVNYAASDQQQRHAAPAV